MNLRWDLLIVFCAFAAASIGLVWKLVLWSRRHKRNTLRWAVVGGAASLYVGIWLIAVEASTHAHDPARKLLDLTQTEIKRVAPGKSVGLGGNGPYSGCRVLLLEHLVFDCLSIRTGEEDGLSPEMIRDAVQVACATPDCPYQGWFRLSILYMSAPRTYSTERGSIVTERGKSRTHRFTLKGGPKAS